MIRVFNIASKNITLKVDEKLYNAYKKYCKKGKLSISKQFKLFIEKKLKKNKGWLK